MAKYERNITGNFNEILQFCMDTITRGSFSATYENGSDFAQGGMRVAVRVFERYSAFGGNRVSLSFTLAGQGDNCFLSAIASGGSQAMFFKVNTLGEEAFLDTLASEVERRYSR